MKIIKHGPESERYLTSRELVVGQVYEYCGVTYSIHSSSLYYFVTTEGVASLTTGNVLDHRGDTTWRWRHVPNAELSV